VKIVGEFLRKSGESQGNSSRKHYYLAEGRLVDSWKFIPKDMAIACWYYQMRDKSLMHFSALGFRTLAGAYYDAADLDNPKWLEALDAAPGRLMHPRPGFRTPVDQVLRRLCQCAQGWRRGPRIVLRFPGGSAGNAPGQFRQRRGVRARPQAFVGPVA